MVLLLATPVPAQTQDTKVEGKAVIGANEVSAKDAESAKFIEYRDVPDGLLFSLFNIRLKSDAYYLSFNAVNAGHADERYDLSYNLHGKFRLDYRWDRIPHRFSNSAVTPYTETAPGIWTLPDNLQSQLQDLLGDNGSNLPQAFDLLSGYLHNAHATPLELKRRRQDLNFTYDVSVPVKLSFRFQDEKKEDYRAIGAPLGFGNVIELPENVGQNTRQGEFKLSYFKKGVSLDFGVALSKFENNNLSMLWDNPYRLTDQMPPGTLTYLLGNGSGTGQLGLAPDNKAVKYFFKGNFKVLKSTSILASLSFTQRSQDSRLLPYTVNTGLALAYPGALSAPRATSDLGADVANASLAFHSRLTRFLTLNAGYKYYDYDNTSKALSLPGHAILDQNWADEPINVGFLSNSRESYYANLSLSLWNSTSIEAGFKSHAIDRKKADLNEGKNTEETVYVSTVTTPLAWLSFRGTYSISDRKWSLENGGNVIYPVRNNALYAFRRYHEAERDSEELTLDLSLTPLDNMGLSFIYLTALNDYDKSQYGLRSDDYHSFSFDANYAIGRHTFYGFYVKEKKKGLQGARQTTSPPLDVISNNPLSDWTALLSDTTTTYGAGLDLALIKDKLDLDMSYSYSNTDGDSLLDSPAGGNPNTAANFIKGLDSTRYTVAKARLFYQLNDRLKLSLGGWYEEYKLNDIFRDRIAVDMLEEGYAFYLGARDPEYKYLVSFVQLIFSW